jgi:hypothetical protein
MKDIDYQNLVEVYPKLKAVLPECVLKHMKDTDKKTRKHLSKLWGDNIKQNVKHHFPKYGLLNDGFADIGRRKAVIAIGAGSSLKKNVNLLKMVSLADGIRPVEEQDFILMASNHQIKPCIEKGIIPHFAMVADGSPNLKPQMDVGGDGKHTILIASITTHPDVIDAWPGPVKFIIQKNEQVRTAFNKEYGKEIDPNKCITEGGNILNLSFLLSVALFRSSVWMCVGNDLSFPYIEEIEERRKQYYADGDYSTNIASKRDEAKNELAWAGVKYPESSLITNVNYINLELVLTSPQMFVYKNWLETNSVLLWENGWRFKIYNCSEGGILGVNLKEDALDPEEYEAKFDPDNWFLMDSIMKGKWRTRKLSQAIEEFHKAKEILKRGTICLDLPTQFDAQYATNLGLLH